MGKDFKTLKSIEEKTNSAKEAEISGDEEAAIRIYEEIADSGQPTEFAFTRLMVLYRKQKKYKEELRVIKKGIQVFSDQHKKQLEENLSEKKNRSEIVKLSNAFMKGAGLVDKKGKDVYYPEPINKWMKRKTVVEKKIK